MNDKNRCGWAQGSQLEKDYHDNEWGVPVHDDQLLFEFLNLESAQAGLSWVTILNKRENYKAAFDNFHIETVSNYDEAKIAELLDNPGIVRNKLKVNATVNNANRVIEVQKEFGSFDAYIWQFVDGKPLVNKWKDMSEVPSSTALSDAMSKDLKKRGFKFIGTTICYAYMQASGMVNDHVTDCFCYNKNS
ncbi:DNA-3-methyladenine glycosylase I [Cocleimonas flava]|uniref:DNA-3-methyladenine glycosylase I n=1 Tax=Cocleimonas flava TaxID=634765 RepID=A0A4R1F218_9GAMM|nr:DNA-3-methyladenine glycosylase I [Cocleimonas flava]TCJ88166.1 DNA-3-methyladenine glycosylase I [Cocleimonas flava]